MAYYLVSAKADETKLAELRARLESGEIKTMHPFGTALDESLRGARLLANGSAIWEENDYCNPPLAMERAAVLDDYFKQIKTEEVQKGKGWQRISELPSLWETLKARD